jgi:tripartite-type tricarboxylate transporter receptor subunit TctC
MLHVPYRGGGQGLTALLAGEVQMMFTTLVQMLPHVREGRVKALAVTSETRSPLAPDIPTMVESGYPQFVTTSVNLLVAPPGTPPAIRKQINEAAAAALNSAEVKQAFARLGAQARPASPDEVAAYMAESAQRWKRMVEQAKISIE